MIEKMATLPGNIIGFRAAGQVTAEDFTQTVLPEVKAHMTTHEELNYMLYLETDLKNFSVGAWLQDGWLGLKNLTNWNRSAIISNSETLKGVTDVFSKIMPGVFRVYPFDQEREAINWVSGFGDNAKQTS
ncbi:STAS/SEC14 domain-containing protein [Niabella insulamsoli]|uniref:STAS/SEC14 domain-containing protein n=1 Tax=Niabella insulamsoli TaxID=3144874 RepID=UPI0031FDAD6E